MTDRLVGGLRCSEVEDLAPAFVLGAVEAAEMDAVRSHLAACPEPHPEMAELGSAAATLLLAAPQVEPPAALGLRILEAARRDTIHPPVVAPAPPAARPAVATPAPSARREPFGFLGLGRPVWATAGVVAILAIAILGAQAFNLQRERDDLAAYQSGVAAVIDTAASPGAQLAVLAGGTGQGPAGIAAVGSDGTVKLAIRGLNATAGSQVYEAWLIVGKNAPEPIGGFAVGSTGDATLQTHGTTATGVIVALTLEPGPGATAPTLPIVASGAAQAKPG
jgi:anti-sigma factor RsiW